MSESLTPEACCGTCDDVTTNIPGPQGNAGAAGADGADGCSAVTTTTEEFIMPGCGYPGDGDVEVTVVTTGCFCPGIVIYIEGAGYFRLLVIVDATHLLLENLCLDVNTAEGIAIGAGSCVSVGGEPGADGTNGTGGGDGSDGINAFTVTTADFNQPAELATVVVSVAESSWAAIGQNVFIPVGGYYEVTAIVAGTLTLKNLKDTTTDAYLSNADPFTTTATPIVSGSAVSPGGIQGPNPQTQTSKVVALTYQVAVGVAPDTMFFAAWTVLGVNTLNQTVAGVCVRTGNTFTLEDGSYTLIGHTVVEKCKVRIRLRNTTDAVDLLQSVNGVVSDEGIIPIFGAFSVSGLDTLQFEYYAIDTPGPGVFGQVTGVPAADEVYRGFMFTKVS